MWFFPQNFYYYYIIIKMLHIVGNKAKGWISKRVFQENKARQIFRKTNISYPLIRPDSTYPKSAHASKKS